MYKKLIHSLDNAVGAMFMTLLFLASVLTMLALLEVTRTHRSITLYGLASFLCFTLLLVTGQRKPPKPVGLRETYLGSAILLSFMSVWIASMLLARKVLPTGNLYSLLVWLVWAAILIIVLVLERSFNRKRHV